MTAATRRRSRPVPPWTPPLDSTALTRVLERVQTWQVYDGDALLDDVADVLDQVAPAEEEFGELAQRLHGHLVRLVNIALAAEAGEDAATARLIERASTVRAEELPGDRWKAIGHLRRMGWAVNELLERLVAIRCLKEAA